MKNKLYEKDFYQWILETSILLKEKRLQEVDLENLTEEIEAMGRNELNEVRNRLITIVEHLLKCLYWLSEKEQNTRGWHNTLIEQRKRIYLKFKDSPSLKNKAEENWEYCLEVGKKTFLKKTQLPSQTLPKILPFDLEQALDEDYLP